MMYEWFLEHSGTVGPQLKRNDLAFPDPSFTPWAQRGIHVPSNQRYAANITARLGSIYSDKDQPLIELPDGTWSLVYSAHRNNKGDATFTRWNEGLMANLRDGVPVGVYLQVRESSSGYYRALAYVESFRPESDVFMLRGPITAVNFTTFASPLKREIEAGEADMPSAEELIRDSRSYGLIRRAVREGQTAFREKLLDAYDGHCAITDCDVPDALQAAHIIGHRGLATNIPSNGMLLRADIHLLYDRGLLSVDPGDYRVVIGSRLRQTSYECLGGCSVRIPKRSEYAPDRQYLEVKHREFQMIERAS